jgi:hypothetical protein
MNNTKHYLLLRNHQESGPYSIEELKSFPLKPEDLIWIEGKSTTWENPAEIAELKSLVQNSPENEIVKNTPQSKNLTEKELYASPSAFVSKVNAPFQPFQPGPDTNQKFPTDEAKEPGSYLANPFIRKVLFYRWIFLIAGAVVIAAIIIRRTVKNQDTKTVTASHPVKTIAQDSAANRYSDFQNALSKEFVPPADSAQVAREKAIKLKNLKKMVRVKSNDYRVGLFGGIEDLKLTVYNNSPHLLDKVTVQVKYLRPNGQTLHTEIFSAFAIKPESSKTISIPPRSRGVKVACKVISVQSEDFNTLLQQT